MNVIPDLQLVSKCCCTCSGGFLGASVLGQSNARRNECHLEVCKYLMVGSLALCYTFQINILGLNIYIKLPDFCNS